MELIDIVNKLTGPIAPIGETNADNARYENLQSMIELMKALHMQIEGIADNKDRPEFSMNRAGRCADEYLDWLGIER